MTGLNPIDTERFTKNLSKIKQLAKMARVSSVIITGKTDPLMSMSMVRAACLELKDFPLEIQTNGILLNERAIHMLDDIRIDIIAISIDSIEQIFTLENSIRKIRELGMTVRFTINLTNNIFEYFKDITSPIEKVKKIIEISKMYGADQISFRKITIPKNPVNTKESFDTQEWIYYNVDEKNMDSLIKGFTALLKKDGVKIAELPFGATVYMYNGISCTYFDYCIQDENNGENIRSLIYHEDGHASTSWYGSNYGRIF